MTRPKLTLVKDGEDPRFFPDLTARISDELAVTVHANLTVQLRKVHGTKAVAPYATLTLEELGALTSALAKARARLIRWRDETTGANRPKVTRDAAGDLHLELRGEWRRGRWLLRRSVLRRQRGCASCKLLVLAGYVIARPEASSMDVSGSLVLARELRDLVVCVACVERSVAGTLRLVSADGVAPRPGVCRDRE